MTKKGASGRLEEVIGLIQEKYYEENGKKLFLKNIIKRFGLTTESAFFKWRKWYKDKPFPPTILGKIEPFFEEYGFNIAYLNDPTQPKEDGGKSKYVNIEAVKEIVGQSIDTTELLKQILDVQKRLLEKEEENSELLKENSRLREEMLKKKKKK